MLPIKSDIQVLSEDDGKYRVYPHFPFEDDRRFEVYSVEVDPGGFMRADAHMEGTEELLTIFDGELTIRVNDEEYTVRSGDSIRFKADRPHSYENLGGVMTRLSMVLYFPN